MAKKAIFTGSAVALVTPFTESGSINLDMLSQLIEFQIKNGTKAIVICGTTGESATITVDERKKIIQHTIKKVSGRVPVIVGTGSNSTITAVEFSIQAQNFGADALLIVTPYYNKTSQNGIVKHYSYISERISIPIILYNVPSRTGMNILPETYQKLSKIPNIVATKEANGDISSIIKTKVLCKDDLWIYSGNDDQTLPILSVGSGVISVFANIAPAESQKIASNSKESRKLLMQYHEVMEALFWDINPIPVKAALKMLGFDCGECRLPLCDMSENLKSKLKILLTKNKII
ncbi:MAG: 4-hydroxy-tetrahydrodipicolinate synthase [Firmicutes bacterium]|nr:4-hydroxy-tetrahydrodipicolinate synthase [Bacillota bacterium]